MQNVMNTLNLIYHPNTHHNYHHIHELSSCLCMAFIEALFLIIKLLYPYLSGQCSLVLFTNIIDRNLQSQGNLALIENSPFLTMCISVKSMQDQQLHVDHHAPTRSLVCYWHAICTQEEQLIMEPRDSIHELAHGILVK